MARLPYEEQKAHASAAVVECLNNAFSAINKTVTSFEIEKLGFIEQIGKAEGRFDRLNSALLELDKAITVLGKSRTEIRECIARLREECPEVVANWKGPAMELSTHNFEGSGHEIDT